METGSLLLQRCPGKDHCRVPALAGNALSICSSQQIRLTCFDKDFKQPVWLMCLRPEAEWGSDHGLSWMTVTPPQPICTSKSFWWRQCALRNFRGIKGNNTSGYSWQSLLKGKRKPETELLLWRQLATKDTRKDLVKLLAWIDTTDCHYHLPLLCFMIHNSTSFSLNQAHKFMQRWLSLIWSSPSTKGWVEVTPIITLGLVLCRKSRKTMSRLKPQTQEVLVIILRHATLVHMCPCETVGVTQPYRKWDVL